MNGNSNNLDLSNLTKVDGAVHIKPAINGRLITAPAPNITNRYIPTLVTYTEFYLKSCPLLASINFTALRNIGILTLNTLLKLTSTVDYGSIGDESSLPQIVYQVAATNTRSIVLGRKLSIENNASNLLTQTASIIPPIQNAHITISSNIQLERTELFATNTNTLFC